MTANQIEYWKLLETQRANQAREAKDIRELEEKERSNLAQETEQRRSNMAKEAETKRRNTQDYRINRDTVTTKQVSNANTTIANSIRREEMNQKERLTNLEQFYTNAYRDVQAQLQARQIESDLERANISKEAAVYQAQMSNAATRYAALMSSEASKYATDTNKVLRSIDQSIDTFKAVTDRENREGILLETIANNAERNRISDERNRIQEEYNVANYALGEARLAMDAVNNAGKLIVESQGNAAKLIGQLGGSFIRAKTIGGAS